MPGYMSRNATFFDVGHHIEFQLVDDAHCTESNGDAMEIDMIGTILSINGSWAMVEHKYGIARVWLDIAKIISPSKYDDCKTIYIPLSAEHDNPEDAWREAAERITKPGA